MWTNFNNSYSVAYTDELQLELKYGAEPNVRPPGAATPTGS